MKIKTVFALSLIAVAMVFVIPAGHVNATGSDLNLPGNAVTIKIFDGSSSNFRILLSGFPSGYDVAYGYYAGWCVDREYVVTRNTPLSVVLYSTLNPPPLIWNQRWDMVNYILNHKNGTAWAVQEAIWYFVNFIGNYTPDSPAATEMVNDAILNGEGFIPKTGQVEAVICYPVQRTQITVIEVTINSPLQTLGDINNDGTIDIQDSILFAEAFGSKVGDLNWNRKADLNNDGKVDMFDAIIMAVNFGKTYP